MLEVLMDSQVKERVLIFLYARGDGYARQIARFFGIDIKSVVTQLDRLEAGGVLRSRTAGRTRLYSFSQRYPFKRELNALLERALSLYPDDIREKLVMIRRRPRRKGKPL
jgi:DNA-binding MarR family transcriptional regulator